MFGPASERDTRRCFGGVPWTARSGPLRKFQIFPGTPVRSAPNDAREKSFQVFADQPQRMIRCCCLAMRCGAADPINSRSSAATVSGRVMAFELPAPPYPKNALEPYTSARTLESHYGKHHRDLCHHVQRVDRELASGAPIARRDREGDLPRRFKPRCEAPHPRQSWTS